MKHLPAVVFLFLLAGCSQPAPAKPAAVFRVDISAGAEKIFIGETVTVTGTIFGSFGDPRYYVTVTDQTGSASALKITILPGNIIEAATGSSAILELASTNMIADTLTAVFRGRAAGSAAVVIGIVGKVGKADSSGRWQYDYTSRYSESITLEVR